MKRTIILACALLLTTLSYAQDSTKTKAPSRKGWTCGVLPSIGFDADLGFQLGALTNIYYFGDGSTYPEYLHSFYAEAAYTTRNYGLFRMSYDSKYLIPKHRLSIDLCYLPDAMCDFYGFNGYQSKFHPEYVDMDDSRYVSRAYYKMKRDIFRLTADLQGTIKGHWHWNSGLGLLYYNVGEVNRENLNRYIKNEDKKLPDTASLYDKYIEWGLIDEAERNGGFHPYLHGGFTFDSRDRQQNPSKGIHADAFLTYNACFGKMKDYNNLKLNLTWRHYVSLLDTRIIFAYRVGAQFTLAGKTPFYVNTYMNQLYLQRVLYEGLGGANSTRGIMRNRVLANGFGYWNAEFRFKIVQYRIGKDYFYIGLNPFLDGGMVLQPYDLDGVKDIEGIEEDIDFDAPLYKPHLSAGCGLKIAMNDNFVLSVDWATALNKQDNKKMSNFYIKMGYMF